MNPALKALGLGSVKLPSRNWMIFWTVLAGSLSGIGYDKYQQRQIINRYCEAVKPLSLEHIDVAKTPRKITVFIAPPPNDYLDTSLKIWRRYIKPILYYAGLDYEVIEEDRQGLIRTEVASRIRQLRKDIISQEVEQGNISSDRNSTSFISKSLPWRNSDKEEATDAGDNERFDPEQARKFKAEFDFRNIMGIYKKVPKLKGIVEEDSLIADPKLAGGVICVGRGAYKEYLTGLHEGLLGPLEPPIETNEQENEKTIGSKLIRPEDDNNLRESQDADESEHLTKEDKVKEENEEEDEDNSKIKLLKPFIKKEEFTDTKIPSELEPYLGETSSKILRNPKNNVPSLLYQPVLVVPVPNLIGFLTVPERIYRFYQRRYFVEEVCAKTEDVVEQKNIVNYKPKEHINLAVEEESDWPKQWVNTGKEKNSEWTQNLVQDERVVSKMHVYELDKEEK
ncbi:Mitochondrial import inner membrane translocase subunit TIM54 [Nakaseomyces bracarensis]|uniref:Mitochondrial import inner membrane translocase subunit TIM54 n=1 Tax=Nakaseomyces bracarensis TaxID=273131 RepID=A0ABR4NVS0_9SACH